MHRTRYAWIVGADEHLGKELDVPVLLTLPGILLSQRRQVMLDVRVVLGGGNDAVRFDEPSVLVELIIMI
jgi:hypothetical protein